MSPRGSREEIRCGSVVDKKKGQFLTGTSMRGVPPREISRTFRRNRAIPRSYKNRLLEMVINQFGFIEKGKKSRGACHRRNKREKGFFTVTEIAFEERNQKAPYLEEVISTKGLGRRISLKSLFGPETEEILGQIKRAMYEESTY